MGGPPAFLLILLGAVSSSQASGSASELTVQAGDNITLYCDCKPSTGVYIMWYRNCSHENQPRLVLRTTYDQMYISNAMNPFPRLHFVSNESSNSYDLLIVNITHSDEGLYYCGSEQSKVVGEGKITSAKFYRYGNVTTRIMLNPSDPAPPHVSACAVCWKLLFTLCPGLSVLSALVASLLVYRLCQKTAHQNTPDTRAQTRANQDEDVCYAALEIRQPLQRPTKKKKKVQSSDFSTYSAINTSRM